MGFVNGQNAPLGLLTYSHDVDDDAEYTRIDGLFGLRWDAIMEAFLYSDHCAGREIRVRISDVPELPNRVEKLRQWGFAPQDENEDDDDDALFVRMPYQYQ